MASARNGVSTGAVYSIGNGSSAAYDEHGYPQPIDQQYASPVSFNAPSQRSMSRGSAERPASATKHKNSSVRSRTTKENSPQPWGPTRQNGDHANQSDEDIPENMYLPDKEDPEGWIHRDKLAKIESEELQAAGINLATARSRSQSRNNSKTSPRDSARSADAQRDKRQRIQSPVEEEDDDPGRFAWDIRSPEEIAADNNAGQMYTNPILRKSGSKIPVLAGSLAPVPAERYERDTPIARKRTASGTMSFEGDSPMNSKLRTPQPPKSIEDSNSSSTPSYPNSPQKARSASATATPSPAALQVKKNTPASRKTSAQHRTTPSQSQRPGTRSGDQDRPRTAVNRPEGEAPWIATMYKPDPRLPPDQQLIPTLAKKQQQAQWAESGAIPKTYDREFTPIAVHTPEEMKSPPSSFPQDFVQDKVADDDMQQLQGENAWPLRQMNSVRSTNSGRPDTPGSITGGYSTMPKITSPPLSQTLSPPAAAGPIPNLAPPGRTANMTAPTRMQATTFPDPPEPEEKEKKGCGCCVVM